MRASRVALVGLVGGLVAAWPLAGVAGAAPPGNNGTVKVDGVAFDDHPDDEPHVGCTFQIDFYGYDQGDLQATYTLTVHPPTGSPQVIASGSLPIGEDPAGGGTDLDGSATVDLSGALAGFEPHPNQGFHVKLTVDAEGSIGARVKHKVFWVTCEGYPPNPEAAPAMALAVRSAAPRGPTGGPTVGQLAGLGVGLLLARALVRRAVRTRSR
ncbi:MAG TPA: hypothetical protein VNO79_12860 [Actinomycetota bacterium]|nr:hypothetical protein [Actinomycetota bacterium]